MKLPLAFAVAAALTLVGQQPTMAQEDDTTANTTTAAADAANSTPPVGCFEYRDLSCDVDQDLGDTKIDINTACLAMEQRIKSATGYAVALYRSPEDTVWHQKALSDLILDDYLCYGAHQAYHKCWWCAPRAVPENVTVNKYFCQFKTCEKPTVVDETVNVSATCDEMKAVKERFDGAGYPATIEFCQRAEQAAYECSDLYCDTEYLGADTTPKKRAMIWMCRTAAFLSLIGAAYIMYDVASHKKNRQTVYHQLLFCMAIFDVVTAVAWSFATAPVPKDKFWVEGANGTEATCTAQAFFIQLGFTSVFYNISLAVYYVLVIVYDWREFALIKVRPYFHGAPLALGFVLAFVGIPFYDWFEYGCHLLPPPDGELWVVMVFAVGPLGLSIISIACAMMTVYCKVRRQARTSKKWSMGKGSGSSSSTLETQVFYQSLWYVLSFLVSWPILFAVYLASVDEGGPYGLTLTIAFVAPLQGFSNFLVYIRPKVNAWKRDRAKQAAKSKRLMNSSTAATNGQSNGSSNGSSNVKPTWYRYTRGPMLNQLGMKVAFWNSSSNQVSGLSTISQNSISLNNESIAYTVDTEPATQHNSLLSPDELAEMDPSVLIAREDREAVLTEQAKREAKEAQPEQAPRVAVPQTIQEEMLDDEMSQ